VGDHVGIPAAVRFVLPHIPLSPLLNENFHSIREESPTASLDEELLFCEVPRIGGSAYQCHAQNCLIDATRPDALVDLD
jgi:hypothetical protein